MDRIRSKTAEFNRRLQPFCKERQSALADFKLENLLTPADCIALGTSSTVKKIVFDINGADAVTAPHYTVEQCTACRNYLIFMLCVTNATRASNIINMTVQNLAEAVHDNEFDALVIASPKYKTSMLYGRKAIVVCEELYGQLLQFSTHIRPRLIIDRCKEDVISPEFEPVFVHLSGGGSKMSHSTISNGLTQLFKSIPAFKGRKRQVRSFDWREIVTLDVSSLSIAVTGSFVFFHLQSGEDESNENSTLHCNAFDGRS